MSATPATKQQIPARTRTEIRSNTSIANQFWYRATQGVVAITFILMLVYLALALNWRSHPFAGIFTTHGLAVNAGRPASGMPWLGLDAGLQSTDVLVSVDGITLAEDRLSFATAQQQFAQIMASHAIGDVIPITIERVESAGNMTDPQCGSITNGTTQCTYNIELTALPDGDFFTFFGMPFVTGVVTFIIGASIIYLRRNQSIALLATSILMMTTIHTIGIFDLGTTWVLIPIWLIATPMVGALLLTLGLRFPTPLPITHKQPVVLYIPVVTSLVLSAIMIYSYMNPENIRGAASPLQFVSYFLIGAGALFILQIITLQRPRAMTLAKRDQANTLIIGISLILIPAGLFLLARIVSFINPQASLGISIEATMPFYITSSLAIAYSVLQYRQFNTDRVISQTITYGIMLSVLVVGYFLLVTGLTFVTQGAIQANNPIIIAITMFVMVMFFSPLRNLLQSKIDSIYYRSRRNYQQSIEEFSQKLTSLVNLNDIISEFDGVVENTLAPSNVFIFLPRYETGDYEAFGNPKPPTDIRFGSTSGVTVLLSESDQPIVLQKDQPLPPALLVDQSRLALLKPAMIAGLSGSGKLNGFVTIGTPRSSAPNYTYEEIRFVGNLISQLAIAIERAQVIDSLQRELKKLDVLSQVGQAVNFTIQFDDLLELIYAQSSRLIDAANFYIALYDANSDQMYYAFFLEDNDRLDNKENLRWSPGDGLIDVVFRDSRAMNVTDYVREMTKRNAKITLESDQLKAWMAVPLVSGSRKLGVLSVAKIALGEVYTDEQFKILDDIGALAASSLDRLRLFNETNVRARQLQVLNDISRQLAASEMEVDPLLEIITSSAVEILNAEAGSLLLVADDNERELEFKVVVGGSGAELIGSRLKAGQGVVGQVAVSGKPVIENDAGSNPQHTEVSDFSTSSLLAVPLIAKENVIGVLEVINKKDGTIFVQEDAELLTTFSGQAAIAIENARLFQMTDQQLAQRVRELEILEGIDSKLNRTLELSEVAQITVDAAMENVSAQAGALGIVTGNPPYLQIVALKGYEEEDYPAGAEGLQWSLREGVLRRVMRSRQADIIYDTNIDPDYDTGLRGSISQLTIPMLSGDDINAILILEKNKTPPFNLSQWAFTQRLAEHASIAIANAQLYAELTRANESKSEFMGFAAHELKNPLTSIRGYSDVMLMGMTDGVSEQQQTFLQTIRSNANRMQTIIDDLRDFAKLEAGQLNVNLSPMDFQHVITESQRSLQKQFDDKHQKFIVVKPENMPLIMADYERLIQVMTNMLSNAHKYSEADTNVTIEIDVVKRYRNKKGQSLGDVMKISVKDEGYGMSEEDLNRLFHEKYFRSENPVAHAQPGTGLGMMITYAIIQLHGGDIWVESTLGEGSSFNFVIPLAPETEQIKQVPETEPASD